jgi:hypothetical protein
LWAGSTTRRQWCLKTKPCTPMSHMPACIDNFCVAWRFADAAFAFFYKLKNHGDTLHGLS